MYHADDLSLLAGIVGVHEVADSLCYLLDLTVFFGSLVGRMLIRCPLFDYDARLGCFRLEKR